jgi:alpha-tubulin suppressor-like RCC1 family protein
MLLLCALTRTYRRWLMVALLLGCHGAANAVTPMVSMGDTHGLALRADGTVWAWGSDTYGQLGLGRPLISTIPLKVPGLSNIRSIAGGAGHSLAVRQDGTVWAWGQNDFGQLGDGTTVDRSSPVQVPGVANAVMVCAGGWHSAILRQDGTVWTWGNNWYGQLGNGTTATIGPPGPVTGLTGVTSIACFGNQTIALLQDRTVRAWGENAHGAVGDGTTTDRWLPVQVSGLSNVVAINGTAALKQDGTVWEWGYNSCCGQAAPNLVPVQSAGVSGVVALSVSYGGGFGSRIEAIKSDGVTFWDWSAGATPGNPQTPVGSLKTAASSPFFTLLLKADGTVAASGLNNSGQLGIGITPSGGWDWYSNFLPVVGVANVAAVATGDSHSLALDANGNVWVWGDDAHGQLGRGATLSNTVPTVVPGLSNIVQVSAEAGGSSLAVDASGNVWAWGLNYHGQLGDGTSANRSAPVRVAGVQNVQAVAVGANWTSMALDTNGNVWAWGNNFYGQLANGTTGNYSTTPAQIAGISHVKAIAASAFHMLAVTQDGTAWAWGGNDNGELGLGTTASSLVPVPIPGLAGVKMVAATWGRSFAVKTDGTVMAWGLGAWGALGDGTWSNFNQLTPKAVPGLTNVVEISAATHALARRLDGSVWGWGQTWGGSELGSSSPESTPGPIEHLGPMQGISAGQGISALLGSDGLLYMGGSNALGQLGDGTFALHSDFVLAVSPSLNGYLNLFTGTAVNVTPALRVPFFVSSLGGITTDSASVNTTIKFNSADVGSTGNVYVFALAPATLVKGAVVPALDKHLGPVAKGGPKDTPLPCVLAQLTSSGQLTAATSSSLQAYLTGVLSSQGASINVLNGVSTALLQGSVFYVGYGSSTSSMVNSGTNRSVATIPGTLTCQPQAPQTGWWWNKNESGRGFSIETQGNHLFMAGYFYEESGRATWMISGGATSQDGSLYNSTLQSFANGQTLTGPYQKPGDPTPAGAITLTFTDARNGTLIWPGGAIPIERFDSQLPASTSPTPSFVPEDGWWWNASESGRGYFMEFKNNFAFMAGYMYDASGNPLWYLASGNMPSPQVFQNSWTQYANGQTMSGTYRPATMIDGNVGSLSIQFQDSANATMTLPNGTQLPITRFRF